MSTSPLISIIMPLYNAAAYLDTAITSIVAQTYSEWELLIQDDGSTDDSLTRAQAWAARDPRIQVFTSLANQGTAATANDLLAKAQSNFIARMDADDIALPNRLELQIAYLQTHSSCIAVGGQCELVDGAGQPVGEKRFPLTHAEISEQIFYNLPIQQPTLMFNRALLPAEFVWYQPGIISGEEHELIFKLFQYGEVHNLAQTLIQYRLHGNNVTLKHPKKDFYVIYQTRLRAVKLYGYKPSIKGRILNQLQWLIVLLLPERVIYPLFYFFRSAKKNLFTSARHLFGLPLAK